MDWSARGRRSHDLSLVTQIADHVRKCAVITGVRDRRKTVMRGDVS